jgi:hypothetical protein
MTAVIASGGGSLVASGERMRLTVRTGPFELPGVELAMLTARVRGVLEARV